MDPIQVGWKQGDSPEELVRREWLVTNGLGGYASGTIGGPVTRRFHGLLIAALPAPLGRTMVLNHLEEGLEAGQLQLDEFVLECGVPVWRFTTATGTRVEKRVVMPYAQNTTYIIYRLLGGDPVNLQLRPSVNFRAHEGLLHEDTPGCAVRADAQTIEIDEQNEFPPLRLRMIGEGARLEDKPRRMEGVIYHLERDRGYEHAGPLWSPGVIHLPMRRGQQAALVASVEPWDVIHALGIDEVLEADSARRSKMLEKAGRAASDNLSAQLVLAADQFLIRPHTRTMDEARIAAAGDTPRTVIAGYHWFTDWGRDTMISLEGLTLVTRRHREAGSILRTFASYIRDGLIPNMFPEGEHGGLYHTADATMWFFHAVKRYVDWTGDRGTLRELLPRLVEIIDHHVRGTRFNIHVDPDDGLLTQGEEGYQLTWMDAKVDGWVVTPRRGKAVEINALFYNALRILERYLDEEGDSPAAERMGRLADRVFASFNARFWYDEGQYLYDVVDPNDPALRPNQVFAISLDHPVLDRSRWDAVMATVERELLTPLGLRSLARSHPDYKKHYDGDLRARDAAYHQGTVWGWLIGPFVDAWRKLNPGDADGARRFLAGFEPHLGQACVGTISEVFDAEEPFTPRGCAAQAWSVAEVLRCLHELSHLHHRDTENTGRAQRAHEQPLSTKQTILRAVRRELPD